MIPNFTKSAATCYLNQKFGALQDKLKISHKFPERPKRF